MSPIISTLANGSARGYGAFSASALPASYESISSVVVSGTSTTSVSITSIPQTYASLELRILMRDAFTTFSGNSGLSLTFNGNTSNIYAGHRLTGQPTSAITTATATSTQIDLRSSGMWSGSPVPANTFAATIINIQDYSTSKSKTMRYLAGGDFNSTTGDALSSVTQGSGMWNTSTAISSIQILGAASYFVAGSIVSLYGIKGSV
jgi:hypothetical protein